MVKVVLKQKSIRVLTMYGKLGSVFKPIRGALTLRDTHQPLLNITLHRMSITETFEIV